MKPIPEEIKSVEVKSRFNKTESEKLAKPKRKRIVRKLAPILALLIFVSINCKSQNLIFSNPCGNWEKIKEIITGWKTIDTINYCSKCDTGWVYSGWENEDAFRVMLTFNPCGSDPSYTSTRKRINNTGTIQQQGKYVIYTYRPKPMTAYEIKLDSIKFIRK